MVVSKQSNKLDANRPVYVHAITEAEIPASDVGEILKGNYEDITNFGKLQMNGTDDEAESQASEIY